MQIRGEKGDQVRPFFINSNICLTDEDVSDYASFMKSVAGNTGNSYITYALMKELGCSVESDLHIKNIYEYDFSNQDADIDKFNNECSHVFLILQDQIRIAESYGLKLPYGHILNFIKKLNKPVIVAGLGANSFNGYDPLFYKKLDPNLIRFLQELSERTVEIGCRGYYTQEVLKQIGVNNTRVIGCPSFFEQGRERKKIEKKAFSRDLKIASSSGLSDSFLSQNRCGIFLQDSQAWEQSLIKLISFNKLENRERFYKQIKKIYSNRIYVFSNMEEWKRELSKYDFFVGLRVHGAICALNSGVPAVIMNGDSRAREMSEFLGIPWDPELLKEPDIEKIYDFCSYDEMNKKYLSLYDNFVEFLDKNNVKLLNVGTAEAIRQPSLVLCDSRVCQFRRKYKIKRFLQKIFSVKNKGGHKIFMFLGCQIKVRRKTVCL